MNCPICRHTMLFTDGSGGRDFQCKRCGSHFKIVEPAKPATRSSAPTADRPRAEGAMNTPYTAPLPGAMELSIELEGAPGQSLRMTTSGVLLLVSALLSIGVIAKLLKELDAGAKWALLANVVIAALAMYAAVNGLAKSVQAHFKLRKPPTLKVAAAVCLPAALLLVVGFALFKAVLSTNNPMILASVAALLPLVLVSYALVRWLMDVSWHDAVGSASTIVGAAFVYFLVFGTSTFIILYALGPPIHIKSSTLTAIESSEETSNENTWSNPSLEPALPPPTPVRKLPNVLDVPEAEAQRVAKLPAIYRTILARNAAAAAIDENSGSGAGLITGPLGSWLNVALSPSRTLSPRVIAQFTGEERAVIDLALESRSQGYLGALITFDQRNTHPYGQLIVLERLSKAPEPLTRQSEVLPIIEKGMASAETEIQNWAYEALERWNPEHPSLELRVVGLPSITQADSMNEVINAMQQSENVRKIGPGAWVAELASTDAFKRKRALAGIYVLSNVKTPPVEEGSEAPTPPPPAVDFGPFRSQIAAGLPSMLKDPEPQTRVIAIRSVKQWVNPPLQPDLVLPSLHDADAKVRATAAQETLGQGEITPALAIEIKEALGEPRQAIFACEQAGGAALPVMKLFVDDARQGDIARRFVAEHADKETLAWIESQTASKSAAVRAWAFGVWRERDPKTFDVELASMDNLAGQPPYDTALIDELAKRKPNEKRQILATLLVAALENEPTNVSLAAATVTWITPSLLPRVVTVASKADSPQMLHLLLPLVGQARNVKALNLLLGLLDSAEAADAAAGLKLMGDMAEGPLLTLLRSPDASQEKRLMVIEILGEVGGKDTAILLAAIARSHNPVDREYATAARAAFESISLRAHYVTTKPAEPAPKQVEPEIDESKSAVINGGRPTPPPRPKEPPRSTSEGRTQPPAKHVPRIIVVPPTR